MSIFLAGALYALAFGMLLPSLMVLAFDGYKERQWLHVAYAPLMHLAASLIVSSFGMDSERDIIRSSAWECPTPAEVPRVPVPARRRSSTSTGTGATSPCRCCWLWELPTWPTRHT